MSKTVTVQERVAELVREHGSYRAAADATGVSASYLCSLAKREHDSPHLTLGVITRLGMKVVLMPVDSRA